MVDVSDCNKLYKNCFFKFYATIIVNIILQNNRVTFDKFYIRPYCSNIADDFRVVFS